MPAVSAGLALPALAGASTLRDVLDPSARRGHVSLAYWLGSDEIESYEELSHSGTGPPTDLKGEPLDGAACTAETCAPLVDARWLPSANAASVQFEATVRIHGRFDAGAGDGRGPDPMALYVHSGPGDAPAFLAWGITGGTPVSESGGTQFTLAAHGRDGLQLSFELGHGAEAASPGPSHGDPGFFASSRVIRLALGDGPFQPKLRRGVYVLAWRAPDGGPLPVWADYRMALARPLPPEVAADTPDTPAQRASDDPSPATAAATEEPASRETYSRLVPGPFAGGSAFSYLLLSVDDARNQETA